MASSADLRLYDGATEDPSLAVVQAIAGVCVIAAGGDNGPGVGYLESSADKESLSWQPPGESEAGDAVTCPTNGTYTLTFDDAHWLQVNVNLDWMDAEGIRGPIYLQDLYSNALAGDDIEAAEAAVGHVDDWSLSIKNVGSEELRMIRGWIDAATPYLEISADGVNYSSPTTSATSILFCAIDLTATIDYDTLDWDEFDALDWDDLDIFRWSLSDDWEDYLGYEALTWDEFDNLTWDQFDVLAWRSFIPSRLAPGESSTLYLRRTIPAATEPAPFIRNHLHFATIGTIHEFRGLYRIYGAAEYRFYRSYGGIPVITDTPYATSPTLPATPTQTFTDGDWRLSVAWFNGVLSSGFYPIGPGGESYLRMQIAEGVGTNPPPLAPATVQLVRAAGGVVRVVGLYNQAGAWRADEWVIGYTTNGVDPLEDTADVTETITASGTAVIDYALPAAVHGTTVKVRLQVRRNDAADPTEEDPDPTPVWVYSDGSAVQSILVATSGPSSPLAGERYRGELPPEVG